MKVLLIQPPHYYDGKTREPGFFPLGLGYIATPLLKSGHDIEVLDIWAHQWTNKEVLEKVRELEYDIVGISAMSTQYAYVKWLTAELRKYSSGKIVIGGALATFSPEIVLKNTGADICVIGEGEFTFKEIVENIDCLGKIKGIYFKQNGEIIKNSPREYIQDLDSIDFPAIGLFPMEIYFKYCNVWGQPDIKAMNMITVRGCPYNCRFCSRTFHQGLRFRSADNIIQEIQAAKEKYGIRGIFFTDDTFVVNKERVYELCDKLEPLQIKWQCQGRVNLVDSELLERMRKAGCTRVGYGIESGSQKILDNMNKHIKVEQSVKAINDTVRAGMVPIIQMMYGYPGETAETLQETVDFFAKLPYLGFNIIRQAVQFSPTVPLPGTELYQQALQEELITDEEQFLGELAGGYNPEVKRLLVNFTGFNETEFWRLKKETERKIVQNHIRKHLMSFLKECFFRVSRVRTYLNQYGFSMTAKAILVNLTDLAKQLRMR